MAFADDVSVLRKGKLDRHGQGRRPRPQRHGGDDDRRSAESPRSTTRRAERRCATSCCKVKALKATDRTGLKSISIDDLGVHSPARSSASPASPATARRNSSKCWPASAARGGRDPGERHALCRDPRRDPRTPGQLHSRGAAEERLRAENDGGREHRVPHLRHGRRRQAGDLAQADGAMRADAAHAGRAASSVKTASLSSPIATLSGGNVQRAVLARELTGEVDLLIVANPCFGLDFSAVAEIRARIMKARNGGAAVLLLSRGPRRDFWSCPTASSSCRTARWSMKRRSRRRTCTTIGEHMAGHH